MTENQLKLNDNKTEALLFPFSSTLKPTISLPDLITLGSHNIPFSDSARNLGFILDSKLSMKKHVIKICQTAYFELKRISSIHSFSLKMQPRLVTSYYIYIYISSHGLTTATVSSWVHLILSSNLSRKFKTLLQGSCCMSTLHLVHYTHSSSDTRMLEINNTNTRLMAFTPSLALDPTFGIHSHKTLDTAQPCHLLKPNWKPSSSHSISILTNISTQFLLQSVYVCVFVVFFVCVFNNTLCKLFW